MKHILPFVFFILLLGYTQPVESQSPAYTLPCVTKSGMLAPGIEVNCDYPFTQRMKNTGGMGPQGPGSGSGLCVFTSLAHDFDWCNYTWYRDFREWMTHKPGGGWPEKVVSMLKQYCKERNIEMPEIVNVTPAQDTSKETVVNLLAEAVQAGNMCGITYSYSPVKGRYKDRYGNEITINHMVNCVGARLGPNRNIWAVMDNNYPEEIQWMDEATFVKVFSGNGGCWFVAVLNRPDPPPIPKNAE